jgi:tRNA (cytidine/uridine-2'-O-)-methyltransferase
MTLRLALYQPDIPQNTGTLLRLGACLGVPLDIIEPCGFALSDRQLRRAGMDYIDPAGYRRHADWDAFHRQHSGRLLLLTTAGDQAFQDFSYSAGDTLMMGRESAGVPAEVHEAAAARLVIPMKPGQRSLNVALAAAMVLTEALRQTGGFAEI